MVVRRLATVAFRNLGSAELSLNLGLSVIHGPNGAGKTNLLEALYFGLTGSSWRTRSDRELPAFGSGFTRCQVEVEDDGERRRLTASIGREEGKRHRMDGAAIGSSASALRPPIAVFAPDRLALVKGAPALRRAHCDRFVAAVWPARAELRRRYGTALAQRNALLSRDAAASSLDAWDRELAAEGVALMKARDEAIARLASPFSRAAEALGLSGASVRYAPRSAAHDAAELAAELAQRRSRDRERRYTGHGPHLDEIELSLGGRSLRRYGSQGEQRTALLALLFAEREVLIGVRGVAPLMLLDDVMSELDPQRRGLLVELLADAGQSLVTATEPAHVPAARIPRVEFAMHAGAVDQRIAA